MVAPSSELETRLALNRLARRIGLLSVSALISGVVVGGIGGRIFMRISAVAAGPEMIGRITENGNRVGEFTVFGTLTLIIFVGVFAGLAGSAILVAVDPWLRWMGPVIGLGYAVTSLAITGIGEGFETVDFLILQPRALNVTMFISLHVLFGVTVGGLYWLLNRQVPIDTDGSHSQIALVLYLLAGTIPALGALLLFALLTIPSFCGCEPSYGIALLLLTLFGAMSVRHIADLVDRTPSWVKPTASIVGYAATVAFVGLGLVEVVTQIQRIL
ncbi:MAG: hypothetical protein WBM90_06080 [Acidimicrobiia bacterium]